MKENTTEAPSASNAEPAVRGTVVTFGETMLRLGPPGHERLAQTTSLDVHVGGTESNVACALARLGTPAP